MARILTLTLNPAIDLTLALEHLSPGEVHRASRMHRHAAGKGINVAQALGDLGHEIVVGGFLGSDNAADFDALFAQRGWTDVFVRVPGETRSNVKVVEQDGRNTDLNSPGFHVSAEAAETLMAGLDAWAAQVDAVLFCGSLPGGLTPEWLQRAIERVKRINARVALDTSGAALAAGVCAAPWLIKPNMEELMQAFGTSAPTGATAQDLARALVAQGVENVVVSDGAAGVSWWRGDGAWHAQTPRVVVQSTVGAGDTLLAAMVHGLLRQAASPDVLRHAAACGTYAVTHVGFGLSAPERVADIEAAVEVTALRTTP